MLRSHTLFLALAAGSATPLAAHATVLNYASAVNGTASTAARWSPAQVPVAADDLIFNATAGAQAYTVTFDAATAAHAATTFNEDTITLSMSSPHTSSGALTIGAAAADVASVTLSTGTWTLSQSSTIAFNIGNVGGSTGTLSVTDDSADLLFTGTNSRVRVGTNGTGTMNITGGGRAEMGAIIVGSNLGSTGTLTVSGAQAISPFQRSTLVGTNATLLSAFTDTGNSTVTVASGALVDLAGPLDVARITGNTSNVTIGGAGGLGGIHDATLDVGGSMRIAANDNAAVPGTANVTVNSNGQLLVGGTLEVGNDPDGGSATLTINSNSLVSTGSVIDGAFGTINHTGGTLTINGGTYTGFAAPLSVSGIAANNVTLRFNGNGTQTLSPAGGVSLKSGTGTGTGNLFVEGGYDLDAGSGDINLGDGNGSTGNATVTGVGSRLIANSVNSDIRIGFNGDGNLNVLAGGQCQFRNLLVPNPTASGTGFVNISGSGSKITTQFLSVGQASGSTGVVQSQLGGTITVTDPGFSTNVRATGTLTIASGSSLTTPGTITVDAGGELGVDGLISNAALVDIDGGFMQSGVTNAAFVDAPVHVRTGGEVEAIFGNLTMGDATSASGVILDSGSTTTVGSGRTLTLLDNNTIDADGAIIMQGGTISSSHLISMLGGASDQISGFGTFDADVNTNNLGVCAPSGTGLVFLRSFFMNGGFDAAGTTIRFGPTCVVTENGGPHNLNCKIVADAGSVIRPTLGNAGAFGPVTMGDGTDTGVEINGSLHLGTNGSLTLNDPDGVSVNTVWDMNGGILACPTGGFTVNSSGIVRGSGTIDVGTGSGDQFILFTGGIDPDAYFPDTDTYHGVATFFIDGTYVQNTNSEYYCEIAGFNNEFQPLNDRISAGDVSLAGTLDVSLIDGYVPQTCHEFTIMNYTSRSGTWTNIIQPPGANVGIRYEATRAVLFFNSVGCDDIDYNNDGLFPDTADIDDFLSVFSGGSCSTGTCSDIDFNNDCLFPDTTDIDSLLTVFSGGPCL